MKVRRDNHLSDLQTFTQGVFTMLIRPIFILGAVFLIFTAAGAELAHAQAATAGSKIVIINTAAFFNEKAGITKIVNASKTLVSDLAPRRTEVQQIVARIDALTKEIEAIRLNATKGVPIDERTFQTKVNELESLKRQGKYKEDDFNAFAQKRQNEIVGPVYAEVMRALNDYLKTKDYGMLFDASKDQAGMLLFASEKYDITRDFVAFFNARPVTAIAPVPR